MKIDPEEFRKRYDELSDEGLIAIERHELTDIAKRYYDEELARRGLQARPDPGVEVAEMDEELVTVATFLFPDEAKLARTLLQSTSIRCYLANEHTSSVAWTWTYALGGLRLMVPVSAVAEAREILDSVLPDDELISQVDAETAPGPVEGEKFSMIRVIDPRGRGRRWLFWFIIFLFGGVDVYRLYLFIVF